MPRFRRLSAIGGDRPVTRLDGLYRSRSQDTPRRIQEDTGEADAMTVKTPIDDCSNCFERITGLCSVHGGGGTGCDTAYHYLGSSPMEVANAGKGEPAVLCGICFRLVRQHNRPALDARAAY
jgi:hypothetical protein